MDFPAFAKAMFTVFTKMKVKIIFLLLATITFAAFQYAGAQNLRNTYRFYNTLATTEPDCAGSLIPTKGLNILCQPSTAATPGQYIQDVLPGNVNRTVYRNNLNWGLKYLNTNGIIGSTYTIQMYIKVVNFNKSYTRIIDFSDGFDDNGIYFTNVGTLPLSSQRCLNFYPNGNFGTCPFFNNSTYYLLTFTRNDTTKLIDIYVNDQRFTSYNDADDFYIGKMDKPIHIFRDDPIGFDCEDGEANFAYLSFANYYSNQADVSLVYNNLNSIVNTIDFSVSPDNACKNENIVVNYTGNIPLSSTQFKFKWDWDSGAVISGNDRGPYVVRWLKEGKNTVTLTISGGGCGSSNINTQQVTIREANTSQTDTSICQGNSFEGHTVSGKYVTNFPNPAGCDSIHTVNLTVIQLQSPEMPTPQTLCTGDSLILNPGNFNSYLWQDGSTKNTFTVKNAGLYSVTVGNKCTSARAVVQVNESSCELYFPTAFSPNKDGKNETFKVLGYSSFGQYSLEVYNRYGQKIFTTQKAAMGWNGKLKGNDVEQGVYIWKCSYRKNARAQQQFLQGTVQLIR